MKSRGFALIDCFSPCVTFNKDNTHEFFKQRTTKLEDRGHKEIRHGRQTMNKGRHIERAGQELQAAGR